MAATFDHNTQSEFYSDDEQNYSYSDDEQNYNGDEQNYVQVYENDSPSSEADSVDSADSCVQEFILQRGNTIAQGKKKKKRNKEHQRWIASWKKGTAPPPELMNGDCLVNICVSTDGYFRAGRKGGYGVIIRDDVGKPIVASAMVSEEVVSFLYHQVQGVSRAFELAVQYPRADIILCCNAKHVARLLNRVIGKANGCDFHRGQENSFDGICKECVKDYTDGDYGSVFPLLKRIGELASKFFLPVQIFKVSRERNKAADYLAKNGAPGTEVLHPDEFPDELKDILCKDYIGSDNYGLPCLV